MKYNRTKKIFKKSGSMAPIIISVVLLPLFVIISLITPSHKKTYINDCTKEGKSECYCIKQYYINECLKETNNTYSRCVEYASNNIYALNIKECY